ncbi:MAG: PIN domain-containing protein [candidate division Zixibacteria bacterium]|nr:PIN domain-containing protein [candidate division Zixibacteria bacterium]
MRVYLDVCCLNRPFDDQTQDRLRFESEAILTILHRCEIGKWKLVTSEVTDLEISRIPSVDRKRKVAILVSLSDHTIVIDEEIERRALFLRKKGFKPFDALHLACAEKWKVDVLLTTDDKFLRKAQRNPKVLKVKMANPAAWLAEVIKNE